MLPKESSYRTLSNALSPLAEKEKVLYLPSFECCGSCAQYRLCTEDWGDAIGFITFNEQTKGRADTLLQLDLSVASFNGQAESDQSVLDLVETALADGGFTKLEGERPEGIASHDPSFTFNTFYRLEYGFEVLGYFTEDDEA